MSDERLKIAVFIDFDNVEIGVKTTLGLNFDIGAVLEAIKERGEIITKVAFGDWKRSGDYGRAMSNHAVRMVQRIMTPGGDKNGADINLALDALEMAFTHDHINAFVIVGGDSDFITLVEKLKQYDKKVFVVGGRQFTSQVMQKNCTEFIAYENVVGRGASSSSGRSHRGGGDRSRPAAAGAPVGVGQAMNIDAIVPLVRRALKVLADREVTPQLGLLKSTLLQLDSSFSERDYGVSSFRDFAEKLAEKGIVLLKHTGRSTLVELSEAGAAMADAAPAPVPTACPRRRRRCRRDAAGARRRRAGARDGAARPARDRSGHGGGDCRGRRARARAAGRPAAAAALADVPAPDQAVHPRQPSRLRRPQVRIDRRSDARLSEGRPGQARTRSSGRPARVRRGRLGRRGRRLRRRRCRTRRPWCRRRPMSIVPRASPSGGSSAMTSRKRWSRTTGEGDEPELDVPVQIAPIVPDETEPEDDQSKFFAPGSAKEPVSAGPAARGAKRGPRRTMSAEDAADRPKRARKAPAGGGRRSAAPAPARRKKS